MQLTSTDRKLVAQAAALASVHTVEEMQAFLRDNGHTALSEMTDYGYLAAACLGVAQHSLRVLAGYLTEDNAGA